MTTTMTVQFLCVVFARIVLGAAISDANTLTINNAGFQPYTFTEVVSYYHVFLPAKLSKFL